MHILVFGATGAIGSIFCDIALKADHRLTLFVRNPGKVPPRVADDKRVTIIEGTLEDEEILNDISRCEADAFVSFAGPPVGSQGTPLADGYKALIPKLVSQHIKRLLILGTPSFKGSSDVPVFKWRLGEWTMKALGPMRGQYREMIAVGEYITSLSVESGIRWTLFRVGGLTNGKQSPVETTFLGSGKDSMWISRASVARWVLDELVGEKWVREMPYICN